MTPTKNKPIELDEVELCYQLLEMAGDYDMAHMTSEEISEAINLEFEVASTARQVYVLHEPALEEMILDSQIHYGILT